MYKFEEESDIGQILQEMSCICADLCDMTISKKKLKADLEYVIDSAEYLLSALKVQRLDMYKVKS